MMKSRKIPLCILLLLVIIPCSVMAAGNISVSSSPTGATILLNGTATGLTTPATIENVPAGTHTILLQKSGYQDATQTGVTVTESATSTVSLSMTAIVSTPTITRVSPLSATNGGWQTVDITGTGFSSGATVTLTMSGQTSPTIAMTAASDTSTTLSRNINLNGLTAGTWTLKVLNSDGGSVTTSFPVTAVTAATVSSITPTSATTNTTQAVTIIGTGFTPASAKIRLYLSGNYIGGSVNSGGTTAQLTGSFDLNQATPATYSVCVLADGTETSKVCGPTFAVYSSASAANGSIYFTSTPSNAAVYVDSVKKGNTPFTLSNLVPGSYVVKIQYSNYYDWADRVTVTAGNQTTVTATMNWKDASTTETTVPTIVITTATLPPTKVKSTKVVPTAWASTPAPTESPVEAGLIIGAVALGCLVLRRK